MRGRRGALDDAAHPRFTLALEPLSPSPSPPPPRPSTRPAPIRREAMRCSRRAALGPMQQMRGRRGAVQFRGPRNAEATDETRPHACCANRCFSQHQQPALAQLQLQPPLTRRIDAANTLANILLLPGGASIRLRHHLTLALRPTRLAPGSPSPPTMLLAPGSPSPSTMLLAPGPP